ncbi:putative helicase [Vibrio phage pVa-21]|nr:putative helicase [Vibrio phage pVa-21]
MELIDNYSRGTGLANIDIVEEDVMPCDGADVDFSKHTLNLVEPDGSDFDYQNPIVAHTSREGHNHNILEVQTGKGKTAMAMKTIVNIGKRTLIITKPGYVDKWTGDLTNKNYSLSLKPGELIRIGGGKSSSSKMDEMDALIEMGRNGELDGGKGRKECKVILISSKTFDNWIKHQLENDVEQVFEQFMTITGCGVLTYDESHEWFRMNYWTFMLLNPARVLDLSATLIPGDDVFIKHRYDERFPKICRYNDLEYDRYIDALGIYYHTTDQKIIDRMNRMKLYNHIEFEKMVMKRKGSQEAYFAMVKDLIDMFYKNKKWEKGQRALIFFASREMCTRFTEYATKAYPDLNVKRHIQGDNYDEFVKADLGVSTPGKSGTAVDIPGLILTIVTVCLSKEDKNLQILGRTRKVRDWDLSPKAIFLHCQQLVKHLVYLKRRQKMFRNKVQSFKILNSKFIIK